MGLSDISGVFSRYFVVGFFLPSFFSLAALKLALSKRFLPAGLQADNTSSFLIIGGLAVLAGLVLVGLKFPITRWMEGYPLMDPGPAPKSRFGRWLLSKRNALSNALRRRQLKRYDRLQEMKDEGALARRLAFWRLDIWFPPSRDEVLPTSLGNRIRASEVYGQSRWGLSSLAAWPRINMLLTDSELQVFSDEESELYFFVNGSFGAFLVALILGADGAASHPHPLWLAWIYPLPLLLSYLLYRGSLGAAERWGDVIRASVDLHRLELYDRLGLRSPQSFAEEREMASAVNNCFFWGTSIPDKFRAQAPPAQSGV
jgi:hypothetical protein